MAFTLQLAQDLIEVEAGTTSPVTVTVINRGDSTDRYELEVEGVDAEWKAIPVPTFAVEPGESHIERFFIRPPRASESLAGNYPFVVQLRSLESGEQRSAQGVIKLKPFHHLTMQIDPKKGSYSPTVRRNVFDITLVNLGNTEHTIQLAGSDPEDDCAYEFENDQVTLGPGQQREVAVTVHPTSKPILSSGKLIGFSISGRSIDTPSVVTTAQAQLEQRSILSPTSLASLAFVIILVSLWLYFRPKPPGVLVTVDPMQTVAGQTVTVSWTAHDANRIVVSAFPPSGMPVDIYDGPLLSNAVKWSPAAAGPETIVANVYRDSVQGPADRRVITVDPPAQPVIPVINSFRASSRRVKKGDSVTFKWSVDNAVKMTLQPKSIDLDPAWGSADVKLDQPDTEEYYIVAYSKDGSTAKSKSIRISVYDPSAANIIAFSASPNPLDVAGTVTLTWQVTGAARIELKQPNGQSATVDPSGTQQFQIATKSIFELVATDAQGKSTSEKVVINIKPSPPVPTQPSGTTTGTPSPTTGTSTGDIPPATSTGNPGEPPTTTGGQTTGRRR